MPALAALEKRLRFFGINKKTKSDLAGFMPVLLPNIDAFTEKFYGHTRNFPEARNLLEPHYKSSRLKERQIKHWIRLFLCKFDEEYLSYALKIGQIHYEQRVPPYLYMGGYSFIQCEIINLASSHYSDAKIRSSVLSSINRLIAMDVDIAMSAYTRQHWLQTKPQKKKTGDETLETVYIC